MDKVPENPEKRGQSLEMQDTGGRVETEKKGRTSEGQDRVILQVFISSLEGLAKEARRTFCPDHRPSLMRHKRFSHS